MVGTVDRAFHSPERHRQKPMGISWCVFGLGLSMLVLAVWLSIDHVEHLTRVREDAVQAGLALLQSRSDVDILAASVEAERTSGAESLAALEQQVSAYVLPITPDVGRFASVVHQLTQDIDGSGGHLRLVSVAPRTDRSGKTGSGAVALVTVQLRGSLPSVAALLEISDLRATYTVRDAIGDQASEDFLQYVQANAPASLSPATKFLFADLLSYAVDPDATERSLTRDMPAGVAVDARTMLLRSGLSRVREVLSPAALALRAGKAWPLPAFAIDAIDEADGNWVLGIRVFGRGRAHA